VSAEKPQDGSAAAASTADDSLDFTHLGETQAPVEKPRAKRKPKRQPKPAAKPEKTSRSALVPLLIVAGVAIAVALGVSERTSQEAASPIPATKSPPAPYQTPAPKSSQAYAPTKPQTLPPTVQSVKPLPGERPQTLPAEFLKELQDYQGRSGLKAIALALDADGRYAYAAVAGLAKQQTANEEALADCARYRAQSAIRSTCRVYAEGDKIVW
jgi:hypothetical protein